MLCKLQSYQNASTIMFSATNELLAAELNLSKATVKRAIATLEKEGFIKQHFSHRKRIGITVCSEKFNKILRNEV